jgi:hypothetical protein
MLRRKEAAVRRGTCSFTRKGIQTLVKRASLVQRMRSVAVPAPALTASLHGSPSPA